MFSQITDVHTSPKKNRLKTFLVNYQQSVYDGEDFLCSSTIRHDVNPMRPSRVALTYDHVNLDPPSTQAISTQYFPRRCYNLDATPTKYAVCFHS